MELGVKSFFLLVLRKLQGIPSLLPGPVIDITTLNLPVLLADAEHLAGAQLNLHVAESRDRLGLLFKMNPSLWWQLNWPWIPGSWGCLFILEYSNVGVTCGWTNITGRKRSICVTAVLDAVRCRNGKSGTRISRVVGGSKISLQGCLNEQEQTHRAGASIEIPDTYM